MRSHCLLLSAFGTLLAGLPIDGKPTSSSARNATVVRLDEAEPNHVIARSHAQLDHAWTASGANSPSRSKDTVVGATSRAEVNSEERMGGAMLEKPAVEITKFVKSFPSRQTALEMTDHARDWADEFLKIVKSEGELDVHDFAQLVRRNADQKHLPGSHITDEAMAAILREHGDSLEVVRLLEKLYGVKDMDVHAVRLHHELTKQTLTHRTHMIDSWLNLGLSPKKVFELLGLDSKSTPMDEGIIVEWYRYVKLCQQKGVKDALNDDAAEALLFDGKIITDDKRKGYMAAIKLYSQYGVSKDDSKALLFYLVRMKKEQAARHQQAKDGGAELSKA